MKTLTETITKTLTESLVREISDKEFQLAGKSSPAHKFTKKLFDQMNTCPAGKDAFGKDLSVGDIIIVLHGGVGTMSSYDVGVISEINDDIFEYCAWSDWGGEYDRVFTLEIKGKRYIVPQTRGDGERVLIVKLN